MKKACVFTLAAVAVLLGLPGTASAEQGNQTFIATSFVPGGTSGTVVASGPISGVG